MGTSFKGAMADGLDAGQSIAKSFRSGVTGAMDFTKKRAEVFANNMVRNAKNISKAFQHPIKIIRSTLVSALRRAKNLRMKPQTARTMPETILRKWVPPGKMPATKSKKLYPGRSRLLLALKHKKRHRTAQAVWCGGGERIL